MRKFLYSPGYGAGWSSWNDDSMRDLLLFDQDIIDFIEGGGKFTDDDCGRLLSKNYDPASFHPLLKALYDKIAARCGRDDPYVCFLGAGDLAVGTVPDHEQFRINEYDGFETYNARSQTDSEWM